MEWRNADAQAHHLYLWPHIRAFLEPLAPGRAVDLGSGSGWIAAQIAAMGHEVIGIDISASGVAVAQNAFPKVRFRQGSVYEDLGEQFDIVVACEVIEHLYEPRRFIANIYRSLRPGGVAILTTPYHGYLKNLAISIFNGWDFHFSVSHEGGHIKFFSPRSLEAILREAGFRDVQFRYAGRIPALARSMVLRAYR
jgi:2-polyprenyl-6-hydroxyphenyl methylase/3-demethylubiquinone-9 3-methyltransferase